MIAQLPLHRAHGEPSAAGEGTRAFTLSINKDSDVPPYSQIRRAVIAARADGTLVAGDRLPPMRLLAQDLNLAVNTVAKAYKELEAAGVIETHGRAGSFITAPDANSQKVFTLTSRYIAAMRKLGIEDEKILQIIEHNLGLDELHEE